VKLLLIAYCFPPSQDPQSIRWYFIANVLAELGAEIDVLTIQHQSEGTKWNFHHSVNIIRVYAGPIGTNLMRLKARLGVENSRNQDLRKTLIFRFSKTLYQRFMNFLNLILPGDIRSEWFPYALRQIRKSLNLAVYDFIITSHEPGIDSLIGLYLKKENRNIKWVADFGDPYVTPLYTSPIKHWYEKRIEKSIYGNSDLLIFTSQALIKHLHSLHPFLINKKTLLLEQGFSYAYSKTLNVNVPKKTVFTLVYTGTFYKNFRNPSNLLKALLMLDCDFEFILAGRNEEFLEDFEILGNRFKYLGLLDYFETLRLQQTGDVLVHLSNNNTIQFPGKFYEYLGSHKPILSVIHSLEDPSVKIIRSLNCGISCRNIPEEIRDAIKVLYGRQKGSVCPELFEHDKIYQYSWEKKAELLWDCLENYHNNQAMIESKTKD
jgi:glycosyltransferase involved in cell wall biosynthesis